MKSSDLLCSRLFAVITLWLVAGYIAAADSPAGQSSGSNGAAGQQQDVLELLDKMSRSFRELSYRGSFSYQRGDQTESLRIAHTVIDGEEYERLDYMDGDKREIVRKGHDLHCIHPGHQLVRFYQHQQNLKTADRGLGEYYRLSMTGESRLAGRTVQELDVSPADAHRFGYRLSLDKETGLLLRSELLGSNGEVLERFQFVDITIGEPIAADFFESATHSYQAPHSPPSISADSAVQQVDQGPSTMSADGPTGPVWMVNWVPGGFATAVSNQKFMQDDMATFTDGLSVFSVFLERNIDPATMMNGTEGKARRGATIAYSKALILAGRPHRVTVVGEIPAQTAKRIALSVMLVAR